MSTVISEMLVRIAADTAQMRSEMNSAQNAVGGAVAGIKNTVLQLAAVVGGFNLAQQFIETADAITLMDARLKLAVGSGGLAQARQDIYSIAQNMGLGLQETTQLYTKLYEPVVRLGGGIKENTAIVQAFSMALKIGGASTQEAASATLQFAQAMGSGKLQGDEFRSIAEASPRLMKALAEGMNVPIESLKKMGSEGKLTADVVGNALMKSLGQLKTEMGSIPDTFGAASQRFKNDVMLAVGELNSAAGATLGLAGAVEEARQLIPAVKDELAGAFQAVSEWIDRNREGLGEAWNVVKALIGDVWELVKAFGRVLGAVYEWAVQSGTLKLALEGLRYLVAGLGDGVEFVAAVFMKSAGYLLDFVGIFSDSAKSAAKAAHAAADATFQRFGEGKTRVMELNAELANNATKTAQAKEALASHGLTAAENSGEMARLRNHTTGQSEALVTLKNNNVAATEEQKKATDAIKKAKEAGDAYDASISQQIASLQKQITTGRELTEAEKEQEKLTELLRSGRVKMTTADEAGTRAKIGLVGQLKEEIAQKKELEKTMAAVAAATTKYENALSDETEALRKSVVELKDQNEKMGLNTTELAKREAAVLRAKAEEKEWAASMSEDQGTNWQLKEQARLLRERADLVEEGALKKEAQEAAAEWKKATDSMADEWQKTTDSINDGLTDALMRSFESGKGFMDAFKSTLINAFKTLVLQPTIKAIMAPISGALGSLFSGNAMAGTGGAGGGLGSLLSSGLDFLRGGTMNGIGLNLVNSGLGQSLGLSSVQNIGGNMIAGPTGLGNMVGSGLGMLGNGMAGFGISSALSGGYSLGGSNVVNGIAGIASMIPGIGPIAGIVGGLVNRAFGRRPRELRDYGLEGSITGGDATGQRYQDWTQRGGWFRSNRSGTDYSALGDDLAASLDLGAKSVLEKTKAWADALNLPAESLANVTANFRVTLTENEAENQAAIELIFTGYQNALTQQFAAVIEPFKRAGESVAEAMSRLVALQSFSESINEFGGVFSRLANASIDARENVIALAGGIDALMQKTGQFVADYYTEAEQAGLQARATVEALQALGLSPDSIGSREDFRALVESIDVSTRQGQEQLVALLIIAPQFATLADYLRENSLTLQEVAQQAPVVDVLNELLPEAQSTSEAVTDVAERITQGNEILSQIVAAVQAGNANIAAGLAAMAGAQATVAAAQAEANRIAAATNRVMTDLATDAVLADSQPTYSYDIGTAGDTA